MRTIQLTQGQSALVDDADFEWLSQWKWFAVRVKKTNSYYASRREGKGHKSMHREVMGCIKGDGVIIDHRNHNGLDNTRANLRRVTSSENSLNRRDVVGTCWTAGKWQVYYRHQYVGRFATFDEAVAARRAVEIRT